MCDTIEVIDGLDSGGTTGFNIFDIFGIYWWWDIKKEKIPNQRRTYDR